MARNDVTDAGAVRWTVCAAAAPSRTESQRAGARLAGWRCTVEMLRMASGGMSPPVGRGLRGGRSGATAAHGSSERGSSGSQCPDEGGPIASSRPAMPAQPLLPKQTALSLKAASVLLVAFNFFMIERIWTFTVLSQRLSS